MPDEMTPRRRRVRQVIPAELLEEEQEVQTQPAAHEQPEPQVPVHEPPRRIVIDSGDDEPDWMVSAGQVSGAASRRGRQAAHTDATADKNEALVQQPDQEAAHSAHQKQSAQVLRLKKSASASGLASGAGAAASMRSTQRQARPERKAAPARARSDEKPAPKKPAGKKKLSKKARARRAKMIRNSVVGVLAASVVIALIVAGTASATRLINIKQTLDRGDGVFYPNIFVNNIPLEGRTLDEAAAVVTPAGKSR